MIKIFGHPASNLHSQSAHDPRGDEHAVRALTIDFHERVKHKQPASLEPTALRTGPGDRRRRLLVLRVARDLSLHQRESRRKARAERPRGASADRNSGFSIETANFAPHAMKFIAHHAFNHPQDRPCSRRRQGDRSRPHSHGRDARQTPFLAAPTSASPMSSSCLTSSTAWRRPSKRCSLSTACESCGTRSVSGRLAQDVGRA